MSIQYLVGDVFDKMSELETGSVDLILTSPPFLALRSYLPADHPDKSKEIGSEATPAEYIDVLLALTAEWRRLLTPHGSLVVELGDTYSGHDNRGSNNGVYGGVVGDPSRHDAKLNSVALGPGWPLAKSLTLIPESYRFALAYGINPHTGAPSPAGIWRVRNVVRWVRPNPPVGALGDKFRPATSELVVACTSKSRWFDLDAVREPTDRTDLGGLRHGTPKGTDERRSLNGELANMSGSNPAGAPPLDWWKISPKGYSGAHYAVFPSELCVKPIKAMCPREVCRTCGQPRRRITGDVEYVPSATYRGGHTNLTEAARVAPGVNQFVDDGGKASVIRQAPTLGFTDCGHDDYRPGLVLDPFAGTGTTLAVAHGHGRDAIGIDIDERSAELARDRVGPMFLEVVA